MPNALQPDVSSYSDPTGNALLARGWDGNAAAQSALGTVQAVQQVQQNQIKLSSDQITLGRQRMTALNDVLGAIGADPTLDNAHARIADAVQSGAWTPDEAQTAFTELSQTDGSPAAIRRLALQHVAQNANIDQKLQMMGGAAPQLVNTGDQMVPVVAQSGLNPGINPAGGAPIQNTTTPDFDNSPAHWKLPNGTPMQGTNAQYRTAVGAGGPSGAGTPDKFVSAANGQGGAPAAPAPAPAGGGAPPPPRRPAPVQAPGGGQGPGLAGPSPMLKGGIEDYRADLNNSAAKMQGVQPLLNALPLIQQLGQTGAGPGTKAWNDAKSALVSAGVVPADATDVSLREEANKYLQQYIAKSALAGRSDQGQLQTQMSSPNLDTSQKATLALTQNAIAADRMEAARPLTMTGNDLSQYGQHRATWTQSQDLRAYKLDLMPQPDRAALMQSMAQRLQKNPNDPEARKFFVSAQNATKVNGLAQPAAGGQGGANAGQ